MKQRSVYIQRNNHISRSVNLDTIVCKKNFFLKKSYGSSNYNFKKYKKKIN